MNERDEDNGMSSFELWSLLDRCNKELRAVGAIQLGMVFRFSDSTYNVFTKDDTPWSEPVPNLNGLLGNGTAEVAATIASAYTHGAVINSKNREN